MAYHPAEFARQGLLLLHEITTRFRDSNNDPDRLTELIRIYDKQVDELMNSRLDWEAKDYVLKNIESFVIGSIACMFLTLITILLLEQLEILKLDALGVTIKIYVAISLIGGIVGKFIMGPKFLSEEEKKNESLLELFSKPHTLLKSYNQIKKVHTPKKPIPKPKDINKTKGINENGVINGSDENNDDDENNDPETLEKKKKKWGLSKQEREERKSILSMRFLLKIAKIKEHVNEEKEKIFEKPVIVILEPDQDILNKLTEGLQEQFEIAPFSRIEDIPEYDCEKKPSFIITECNYPDKEKYQITEELSRIFDFEKTAVVMYTRDENLETLVKAKELSILDVWIKEYSENNELIFEKRIFIGKINHVLNTGRSTFIRQMERRIRRREFQEMNEVQTVQEELLKVLIVSTDYLLVSYLQEELEKYKVAPIFINNPQSIFGIAVSEKPNIILLDESVSEDGILNICKMINIRIPRVNIILIIKSDVKLEREIKIKDLKIIKKFSRPYNQEEISKYIIGYFKLQDINVNSAQPAESEIKAKETSGESE